MLMLQLRHSNKWLGSELQINMDMWKSIYVAFAVNLAGAKNGKVKCSVT